MAAGLWVAPLIVLSIEERRTVVARLYQDGRPVSAISDAVGRKKSEVYDDLSRFPETGNSHPERGGRPQRDARVGPHQLRVRLRLSGAYAGDHRGLVDDAAPLPRPHTLVTPPGVDRFPPVPHQFRIGPSYLREW